MYNVYMSMACIVCVCMYMHECVYVYGMHVYGVHICARACMCMYGVHICTCMCEWYIVYAYACLWCVCIVCEVCVYGLYACVCIIFYWHVNLLLQC
jgi:hypothetical protein